MEMFTNMRLKKLMKNSMILKLHKLEPSAFNRVSVTNSMSLTYFDACLFLSKNPNFKPYVNESPGLDPPLAFA